MPQLARDLDPAQLRLTPSEGYLLSRVDGKTSWSLLRDIGGIAPDEVDRCLRRWLAEGVVVLDAREPPPRLGIPSGSTAEQPAAAIDPSLDIPVDMQERILAFKSGLSRPYHEILGVPPDAPRNAIKKAYFALSKDYHPDRYFRRQIGPYQQHLDRIFKKVVEAYELLSDPTARAELERSLSSVPDAAPPQADPVVAPEAGSPKQQGPFRRRPHVFSMHRRMIQERRRKAKRLFESGMAAFVRERWVEAASSVRLAIAFDPGNDAYKERFVEVQLRVNAERAMELIRRGEEALELRDFAEALHAFDEALHYRPHDPELLYRTARLTWLTAQDLHRAKELAQQACELRPDAAPYRRTLGQIYKAAGLNANARRELEAALRLDPSDAEAEAELRALSGRLRSPQWLGGKR